MNARNWEGIFVFRSVDGPAVCPSSPISWKEHGFWETKFLSSLSYLAMVCGGRAGEGREREKKKTEIVNDCRFLRKIELEAFVVRMKIARFPSAGTMGLRVLRGIENK